MFTHSFNKLFLLRPYIVAVILCTYLFTAFHSQAEPIRISINDSNDETNLKTSGDSDNGSLTYTITDDPSRPNVLKRRSSNQTDNKIPDSLLNKSPKEEGLWELDLPAGYAGPSGILPKELGSGVHFAPVEDRWRIGIPKWDRFSLLEDHPKLIDQVFQKGSVDGREFISDYPYVRGDIRDPFHQNILKGDYPVLGQHTFFNITATSETLIESRDVPTPTTPFESTIDPHSAEFFGDPDQFFAVQDFELRLDFFHGNTEYKPVDWRFSTDIIYNLNYLDADEYAIVSPDVRDGTTRRRDFFAVDSWFFEKKLHETSVNYDYVSARVGSQFFTSDFRGFIFSDTNRAVRLFGTRNSNRNQFNLIWFDQTEKDTNSEFNTFKDRNQNTFIANYYAQDFIWLGYNAQASFHYNRDKPTLLFDDNGFLVRPDPVGVFSPHEIESYYFGFTGNGHIGRVNVSNALYYVDGRDSLNPLAGKPVNIQAWMAALELSIDRDWMRFRTSYLYASGDKDINDGKAQGFDAIFDDPNFAGGEFSYWQRQAIGLFGTNLVNRESLVPNLRRSKTQGQTNFVNPGLHLLNVGIDADLTPRSKVIGNVNFLWFDHPELLDVFVFQDGIDRFIGTDLSIGYEFRPLLNDNIQFIAGISGLIPGKGMEHLYQQLDGETKGLFAGFVECILRY